MNNRFPPDYYHEPDDFTPHNIPHHEPPFVPYADWPHNVHPRWNDSEPAIVQPWWNDCCHHEEDDCICVTSADYARWNTLMDLSGLSAFNPDDISAALSAYEMLGNYSALEDVAGCMSANSGLWNSAGYVPSIYSALSGLQDEINKKMYTSSWSGISTYPEEIQGLGTLERPLHLSNSVREILYHVRDSLDGGCASGGLANSQDLSGLIKDINTLGSKDIAQDMALSAIYDMLKGMGKTFKDMNVEFSGMRDDISGMHQEIVDYSKFFTCEPNSANRTDNKIFYYWDSTDTSWDDKNL